MRAKSILLLGFLCFFFTSEAKGKSDYQKMNLQSKVKTITEITYEALDKFGEITKGEKKIENIVNEINLFSKQLQSASQLKGKKIKI